LINQCKSDEEFRLFSGTCMLDGLAFLPVCGVAAGLDHLRSIMPPAAGPLVDYFDSTYVNGACRPAPADNTTAEPRRRRPCFPPTTWNVHELTLNGGDRTNNSAESWNRRFECLLGHNGIYGRYTDVMWYCFHPCEETICGIATD